MPSSSPSEREIKIAEVLRPLGEGPLSRAMAERAGKLLGVHWTSVYRLRKRFLAHPVASAVKPRARGPQPGRHTLKAPVEAMVTEVLEEWLPRQKRLAAPLRELTEEIHRRCAARKQKAPGRNTVAAAGPRGSAPRPRRSRTRRSSSVPRASSTPSGRSRSCRSTTADVEHLR